MAVRRRRTYSNEEFLDTPMWRLVDRHRALLKRIRTLEDAEFWGYRLIGEHYPDVPKSRGASGRLAALVGLTDYMDFYCSDGMAELVMQGKSLEEARETMAKRMRKGFEELVKLRKAARSRKRGDTVSKRSRPRPRGGRGSA